MSIIKNGDELAVTPLRKDALAILEAGLSAIDTGKLLRKKITFEEGNLLCVSDTSYICSLYERIYFIGIGKCALDGAVAIEEMLGDRLTDGIVIDVRVGNLKKIRSYAGTHPYPSDVNVTVTREIMDLVHGVTERDLVLVLISGGGSSLLCMPHELNCEQLSEITEHLTKAGATIHELNTVRKHLSDVQGGQLAALCYPAQVVSLIFSDVLGNDVSMIASGPTVLDTTTAADARAILDKYNALNTCVPPMCTLKETPKDPKYFRHVKNVLVATNMDALDAMRHHAQELGYDAEIADTMLAGEARTVGTELAQVDLERKHCKIYGGETTVTITGEGRGGRNQEVALGALSHVRDGHLVLSAASDGFDNSDHAGAFADLPLSSAAQQQQLSPLEYLRDNDSYGFFAKAGGAIVTGRLGVNVSDLFIVIAE